MRALVYEQYGGPDHLHVKDIPIPQPKDDEVLVKVHAVSVNDWDWGLMQKDLFNRSMNGFGKPKRQILGSDIAGTIEAVGKDVKNFKLGDEVYGDLSGRWGGFAEFVCAQEKSLAIKPTSMSFIDAAAIPQAGMLALQGLRDSGKIKSGQKILINGAGGGVGTLGIQIAKQYDVEVTGVDNAGKLDMMKSLGFDHVIDYNKTDFTTTGQRYDLILDAKTNRSIFRYTRALTKNGIYATVGGHIGKLLLSVLLKPVVLLTSKKRTTLVMLKPNGDLEFFNKLHEQGKLKPVIDGPYTLEQAPEAFRIFGRGEHKGKMVIKL